MQIRSLDVDLDPREAREDTVGDGHVQYIEELQLWVSKSIHRYDPGRGIDDKRLLCIASDDRVCELMSIGNVVIKRLDDRDELPFLGLVGDASFVGQLVKLRGVVIRVCDVDGDKNSRAQRRVASVVCDDVEAHSCRLFEVQPVFDDDQSADVINVEEAGVAEATRMGFDVISDSRVVPRVVVRGQDGEDGATDGNRLGNDHTVKEPFERRRVIVDIL